MTKTENVEAFTDPEPSGVQVLFNNKAKGLAKRPIPREFWEPGRIVPSYERRLDCSHLKGPCLLCEGKGEAGTSQENTISSDSILAIKLRP